MTTPTQLYWRYTLIGLRLLFGFVALLTTSYTLYQLYQIATYESQLYYDHIHHSDTTNCQRLSEGRQVFQCDQCSGLDTTHYSTCTHCNFTTTREHVECHPISQQTINVIRGHHILNYTETSPFFQLFYCSDYNSWWCYWPVYYFLDFFLLHHDLLSFDVRFYPLHMMPFFVWLATACGLAYLVVNPILQHQKFEVVAQAKRVADEIIESEQKFVANVQATNSIMQQNNQLFSQSQ